MVRNTRRALSIFAPEPSEAAIQHEAYLLWLQSGREAGHDLDNWLTAKELLRHRRLGPELARFRRFSLAPDFTAPRHFHS